MDDLIYVPTQCKNITTQLCTVTFLLCQLLYFTHKHDITLNNWAILLWFASFFSFALAQKIQKSPVLGYELNT
jgi:hypothetical protein